MNILAFTSKRTMYALPALDWSWMNLSLVALISSPEAVLRLTEPGGKFLPCMVVPGTTCLNRTFFSSSVFCSRPLRSSTGT